MPPSTPATLQARRTSAGPTDSLPRIDVASCLPRTPRSGECTTAPGSGAPVPAGSRLGGPLALGRGRAHLVGARLGLRRPAAIPAPQPGPLVRIVAVLVDVPVRAPRVPHRSAEGVPKLAIEALGGLAADLDPARVGALELPEGIDHVVDPRLVRVDDRAAPAVGVWPVEQEHVREAGNADPQVGARHPGPFLGERAA